MIKFPLKFTGVFPMILGENQTQLSCEQLQQGQHGTAFSSHQEQGTAPGFPLPIAQGKMLPGK